MKFQHSSLLLLLASIASAFAQNAPLRFQGEVAAGATFRKEIGHGLVFVLKPVEAGWAIAVEPVAGMETTDCKDNFASVIGVPLRGFREVDLSPLYGNTAAEVVALTPRDVDFVLTAADCKREDERRNRLVWPSQYTQKELEEAQANFGTSPAGKLTLKILDSEVAPGGTVVEGKDLGKVERLKFEVVVTFPKKG